MKKTTPDFFSNVPFLLLFIISNLNFASNKNKRNLVLFTTIQVAFLVCLLSIIPTLKRVFLQYKSTIKNIYFLSEKEFSGQLSIQLISIITTQAKKISTTSITIDTIHKYAISALFIEVIFTSMIFFATKF